MYTVQVLHKINSFRKRGTYVVLNCRIFEWVLNLALFSKQCQIFKQKEICAEVTYNSQNDYQFSYQYSFFPLKLQNEPNLK